MKWTAWRGFSRSPCFPVGDEVSVAAGLVVSRGNMTSNHLLHRPARHNAHSVLLVLLVPFLALLGLSSLLSLNDISTGIIAFAVGAIAPALGRAFRWSLSLSALLLAVGALLSHVPVAFTLVDHIPFFIDDVDVLALLGFVFGAVLLHSQEAKQELRF